MLTPEDYIDALDPDDNIFHAYQTPLYTIDEFRESNTNFSDKNTLKFMTYNVRSFNRNIDMLLSILESMEYKPDILVLTETWLHSDNVQNVHINGYQSTHCVRSERQSGGVSIFFSNSVEAKVLDQVTVCNACIETCSIKFQVRSYTYYVVAIYRPHSGTVQEFCNALRDVFVRLPNLSSSRVALIGDFNVNLLHQDLNVRTLCEFLRSYFFIPTVNNVTRHSRRENIESSLLDHIWINFIESNIHTGVVSCDRTDHCPVFMGVPMRHGDLRSLTCIKFRDHSDSCLENFRNELDIMSWDFSAYSDVHEKVKFFTGKINVM